LSSFEKPSATEVELVRYKCLACGVIASFYAFRGASDGSYLKCFNCGSTRISRIEEEWDDE